MRTPCGKARARKALAIITLTSLLLSLFLGVQVARADTVVKTVNTSPSVTVYAPDGSGTLSAAPSTVYTASGAAANLTFTYRAAPGGVHDGSLTIDVPAGWTAPAAGSVTASTGAVAVAGRRITVSQLNLAAADTLTLTYHGTAPSDTLAYTFSAQAAATAGGLLTSLASSPVVTVVAPASGSVPPASGQVGPPTVGTSGTAVQLKGVAYGGGSWVAVGNNGTVLTSSDAVTWSTTPPAKLPPGFSTVSLSAVTYGGGQFVAIGAGTIITWSGNAADNWQSATITPPPAFAALDLKALAYGAGSYVAVGTDGGAPPAPVVLSSTDGSNWQVVPSAVINANGDLSGVAFAAGKFVLVGASPYIYVLTLGSPPQYAAANPAPVPLHPTAVAAGQAAGHDRFVVSDTSGALFSSADGITWSVTDGNAYHVAYGAGLFVGADWVRHVWTSTGGSTWTSSPMPLDAPGAVAYGAGRFVIVGANGAIVSFPLVAAADASVTITNPTWGAYTNSSRYTFQGSAPAGANVSVTIDGAPAGTARADGRYWSFTPPAPLADGNHTVSATAAGQSTPSVPFTVKAAIPAVAFDPLPGGGLTNQNRPTITGTAELGSTVRLYVDGAVAATLIPDAGGHWRYTPAVALADGGYTLKATATDAAGNAGVTANHTLRIKTSAPAVSVVQPGGNNPPGVTGSAEAGSTVRVYINGGFAGTAPATDQGAWSFTLPALADGQYWLEAEATDAAGNVGWSNTVVLRLQTPSQPVTITSPAGGSVTGETRPPITGTAIAGSKVVITLDGVKVGAVPANSTGRFAFTPATPLTDGDHTVSASATDPAGNTSNTASIAFTVKSTAPASTLSDIAGRPDRDAIIALVQQGVLAGFPDGTFRPEIGVTRAQMAVVYAKALDLQPESAALLSFTDSDQIGDWAAPYVAAMFHQGLLLGYPDGSFHPNATISRSELASMLARILKQRGIRVQAPAPAITDALPDWAAGAIRTVTAAGLMSTSAGGAFAPDAPATRGQTAAAFYRLLALLHAPH